MKIKYLTLALLSVFVSVEADAQSSPPAKDIPAIAKAAKRAIVTIVMANDDAPIVRGTGFLVSRDGVIVTNYHVIKTGNVGVVKFSDGRVFPVDGLLAANKFRDLAIIKIDGDNFQTLTLGNSDRIQIGEGVVAIGNPLGLELTVSNGILSAMRTIEKEGGNFLQVTAPISQGSSGGPLFNMAGEVVGITSMYFGGGENLNFAIPINDAKRLLQKRSAVLYELPNETPHEDGEFAGPAVTDNMKPPPGGEIDPEIWREFVGLVARFYSDDYVYDHLTNSLTNDFNQRRWEVCKTHPQIWLPNLHGPSTSCAYSHPPTMLPVQPTIPSMSDMSPEQKKNFLTACALGIATFGCPPRHQPNVAERRP